MAKVSRVLCSVDDESQELEGQMDESIVDIEEGDEIDDNTPSGDSMHDSRDLRVSFFWGEHVFQDGSGSNARYVVLVILIRSCLVVVVVTFFLSNTISSHDCTSCTTRFHHPEGVSDGHEGYVFVVDTGNHAIRIFFPLGTVTTIAGCGSGGGGYNGTTAGGGTEVSLFSSPSGIAVWRDWLWWPYPNPIDEDSYLYKSGNGTLVLFVANTGNHRIQKIHAGKEIYNHKT